MTDPIRAALKRLVIMANNELDTPGLWVHTREQWDDAIAAARAALAALPPDGPAVPEGREPAAVAEEPSDEALTLTYARAVTAVATEAAHRMRGAFGPDDMGRAQLAGLRAVLARYGRPATMPAPAAEEVGELVALIRQIALAWEPDACLLGNMTAGQLTRVADLLEQRQAAPVPVAVSERLPEPSVKVLAHYFNDLGKGRTICAIWVPAKTQSDSYGNDDFTEYDEATDKFYWPEGWYEAIENWDDLGYVKVDEGEVIYWQPLPKWPARALPLPSGEVEA